MNRSFSHYTDGIRFYLSRKLKIIIPRRCGVRLAPSRAGSLPHLECVLLLAKGPIVSAQNNQVPQNLVLLKPQHPPQ
jgi:hypothetical protein